MNQKFDGKYGQVEIGAKYVGLEFHHSRPFPSRFSFYYPVANSLDLSTDYWQRDRSQPFSAIVQYKNRTDRLAQESCTYSYTPYQARFERMNADYRFQIEYDFCDDLPLVAVRFSLKNITGQKIEYSLVTELNLNLRTCHSYAMRTPVGVVFNADSQFVLARFESNDTDSSLLFIITHPGRDSTSTGCGDITGTDSLPVIQIHYNQELSPDQEMNVIQLIGTCKPEEWDSLYPVIKQQFQKSLERNRLTLEQYVRSQSFFYLPDTTLLETYYWSKAIMAANRHYLNGNIVPMPCPAEYNFFFTHDALLTDLGAVYFDTDRVRRDLIYLYTLARPDSILPHAYYFKDGKYQTEFCTSDNWNHLWFLILTGSYYLHSSDTSTVQRIYPMLKKSVDMMLQNKGTDQLMYAFRPDWWDIGHIYGARSYLTILMIEALRSYVRIGLTLAENPAQLQSYLQLCEQMEDSLSSRFWDERKGFLFNMLDTLSTDTHYYAGSLLGAVFDVLDHTEQKSLLETARKKLLDPNIGIRIVMPADFDRLIDVYKFNGMEMGAPYIYINGGCWPHGTAWYILGQIQTGEIEEAYRTLKKYLTLDGIAQSPNGQPSFYEYRNTDPLSQQYGQIDKPTFLWAAGWYLYSLYHLTGVRENSQNIYFHPVIPSGFKDGLEFDLMVYGSKARVQWQGSGKYFKQIRFDDQQVNSSITFKAVRDIKLIRGKPFYPYVSELNVNLRDVSYDQNSKTMKVKLNGVSGQSVEMEIVTPFSLKTVTFDKIQIKDIFLVLNDQGIRTYKISFTLPDHQMSLSCRFR